MPLIPALGRQRQGDLSEFDVNLVYKASSKTVKTVTCYTEKFCCRKKKKERKKERKEGRTEGRKEGRKIRKEKEKRVNSVLFDYLH